MSIRRSAARAWRCVVLSMGMVALVALPAHAEVSSTPVPTCQANNQVYAIAVQGDTAYIGGEFSAVLPVGSSTWVPRQGVAACSLSTGQVLPWDPEPNGNIRDIAIDGTSVYLVGNFGKVGAVPRLRAAAVDAVTGSLTPWDPHADNLVAAVAIGSNSIYMGGLFHTIGVKKRIRLAEVDKLTGTPTKWRPKANKEVDDFLVQANRLLIGGKFTRVNDTDAPYLEPLDLTTGALLPWNTPAAYRVLQIDSDGTNIYTAEAGPGARRRRSTRPERPSGCSTETATARRSTTWAARSTSAVTSVPSRTSRWAGWSRSIPPPA